MPCHYSGSSTLGVVWTVAPPCKMIGNSFIYMLILLEAIALLPINSTLLKITQGPFRLQYGKIPLTWNFLHSRRDWRDWQLSGVVRAPTFCQDLESGCYCHSSLCASTICPTSDPLAIKRKIERLVIYNLAHMAQQDSMPPQYVACQCLPEPLLLTILFALFECLRENGKPE